MSNDLIYRIVKKNDEISWDDVRNVIIEAHQENLSQGLVVSTTNMTSEQLKSQLGEGVCFLAVKDILSDNIKSNEIIGVAALKIHNVKTWYIKGPVVHFMFGAVLPKYKGLGVYRKLQEVRYEYVRNHSISCITTSTAEKNYRMRKILNSQDFFPVRMFSASGLDHYSIRWVKWLDKRPYSLWYLKYRYMRSLLYTKIRFTPNHIKRFGI